MKKIGSLFLTGILTLSMATGVFATEKKEQVKTTDVALEVQQLVEVLYEGESIDLAAYVAKKGSSYDVSWTVEGVTSEGISFEVETENYDLTESGTTLEALEVEGTDNLVDTYISTATFTGYTAGVYLITASINMQAGNSHVTFTGSDSVTQEVLEVPAVVGVKNIIAKTTSVVAEYNKQEKVTGYNVVYDLYLVFENDTEELLTTGATTNLGASGNSKVVDVEHNGTTYEVTVSK